MDALRRAPTATEPDVHAKLDEILRRVGGGGAALENPAALSLEDLRTLADGFGAEPGQGKPALVEFLQKKAEEYVAFRDQIEGIDERTAGLGNLKAAAREAAERLDFEEVEMLLARVDEGNCHLGQTLPPVRGIANGGEAFRLFPPPGHFLRPPKRRGR